MNKESFTLTTAISYTNGPPHIGHVYEAILADCLVRYNRLKNPNFWFLTGTDEHGQKIADTAKQQGLTPIELCDQNSQLFKSTMNQFGIGYSRFIRTTDIDHIKNAQDIFQTMQLYNDIYLGEYVGWYNKREENFLTDLQAKLDNYRDPVTGIEYQKVSEPSYFFRLQKYRETIIDIIKENVVTIEPETLKNNILTRLVDPENPLEDISISRVSVKWGIPVPFDPEHTMYVWFEALLNYISGTPIVGWPADIQVIGKDIGWFHCVIWIAMLLSIKRELPKTIYAHGFINDSEGNKMSKSLGNVISPNDLLKQFPVDTIRYLLLRNSSVGQDLNLSIEQIKEVHNSELLAKVGNYVARVFSMIAKYHGQIVPTPDLAELHPVFDLNSLHTQCQQYITSFEFNKYVRCVIEHYEIMNGYINGTAIYKNDTDPEVRLVVLRNLVEGLYILNHYLEPICPNVARLIFEYLTVSKAIVITNLKWGNEVLNGVKFLVAKPLIYTKL